MYFFKLLPQTDARNVIAVAKFVQVLFGLKFMLPVKLFPTDKVFLAISPLEKLIVAKI